MKKQPIIIHYGCMASQKSLALIQEYRKARSVDQVCLCYVPLESKDPGHISSRFMAGEGNGLEQIKIPAVGVADSQELFSDIEKHLSEIYEFSKERGVVIARLRLNVIIDEIQMFDEGIKSVIEDIAQEGMRVVGAGLALDFRGEPFPLKGRKKITLPDIMGIATEVHQHYARCAYLLQDGAACGENATRSQRFRDIEHKHPSHYKDKTVDVEPRKYIPVCETHHQVPGKHNRMRKT